ncbi:MAG: hypothetical protein GY749_18940, partial [Desulfobacteraceae bacterium]|nr:hypothetical protein [Desulfobacteraceae bacterium]
FAEFDEWVDGIPRQISKSRVILARRKSGKTAFIQRIFNRLWNENGEVVPFFISIPEAKIWYTNFAVDYYCKFASQYISFLERDESLVDMPMGLNEIKEYALATSASLIVRDINAINEFKEMQLQFSLWQTAFTAPKRFAKFFNRKTLVIIDEFQNISQYVYPDRERQTEPDETLAGSFHDVSESKIAPMLVTGSYVGRMVNLMNKYLEAGRLKQVYMNPYLTPEEGLYAVYKYSEVRNEPVTNETAVQINELCGSDPFFISCVMQSRCKDRNLTTREGVMAAVNYEISDRKSEMNMTWGEYIEETVDSINDVHARNMLLHLSKHPDRDWTHRELKNEVCPDMGEKEILRKLKMLAESDLIRQGVADIQFRGLRDGTLCLILRNRFEMEIGTFEPPDLRPDFSRELEQ